MSVETLDAVPEGAVFLGEGQLSWYTYERVGDRYGTVGLYGNTVAGSPLPLDLSALPGRGRLVAEIVATRESHHIGDLFYGFVPGGAEVGQVVLLNSEPGGVYVPDALDGTAGVQREGEAIGVCPDDGRGAFWLNPLALYRCHAQTVRLYVEPR